MQDVDHISEKYTHLYIKMILIIIDVIIIIIIIII